MLTFNLNKAPPTLVEMNKKWSRFKWHANVILGWSLAVIALLLLVVAPSIPGLEHYFWHNEDFSYNIISYAVRFLPMTALLVFQMIVIANKEKQVEDLEPISKAECFDIAKGLNQPLIANYCAQVAAQGRELVAGEYNAIIQQIQIKEAESFNPQTEAELEAACKKVYGVATS